MDVEAYFLASRRLTTPPPPTPASRRPRRPGWRSWRPPLWPGPLWRGRRQGDLGGALLTLPVLLGQGHALQSLLLPRLLLLDVALVASDVLGWPAPAAADLWPCPLTPSLPRSHRTSRRGFRLPHWSSLVVLLRPLPSPPPIGQYTHIYPPPPPGRPGWASFPPSEASHQPTSLRRFRYSLFVSLGECELGTSERDRESKSTHLKSVSSLKF